METGSSKVAPRHCTGERAIARFAAEYGDGFVQAGVGRVIAIEQ
jgi:metal-dependent hydrolase (beta-lactamase superfamily II)